MFRELSCRLFDPLSKFVHVNPFSSLLVNELSPFSILRNKSIIKGWIIINPRLLSYDISNTFSLSLKDGFYFRAWLEVQMFHFYEERWLVELMERWWR